MLCLLDGFKDVLPQPFATNSAIVSLDISVLLGLAGLDVCQLDTELEADLAKVPARDFAAGKHFKN